MRSLLRLLAPAALVAAACQSAPQPRPSETAPAPEPEREPLELLDVTATNQTLRGATLVLTGRLNEGDASALTWRATALDGVEVGSGTARVSPDDEGRFTAELPITFGSTREALEPFQQPALDVLVEVTTNGQPPLTKTRNARIRGPLLPTATVLSVQATREGPQALALTYLLAIRNPNPYEIRIGNLTYEASIADRTVLKSDLPLAGKAPGSAEQLFEIPALADETTYGKDINALFRQRQVTWGFTGTVTVSGNIPVPIDVSGELKLSAQ